MDFLNPPRRGKGKAVSTASRNIHDSLDVQVVDSSTGSSTKQPRLLKNSDLFLETSNIETLRRVSSEPFDIGGFSVTTLPGSERGDGNSRRSSLSSQMITPVNKVVLQLYAIQRKDEFQLLPKPLLDQFNQCLLELTYLAAQSATEVTQQSFERKLRNSLTRRVMGLDDSTVAEYILDSIALNSDMKARENRENFAVNALHASKSSSNIAGEVSQLNRSDNNQAKFGGNDLLGFKHKPVRTGSVDGLRDDVAKKTNAICIVDMSDTDVTRNDSVWQPSEETTNLLSTIDDWGFDVFRLDEVSAHRPLSYVTAHVVSRWGLLNNFRINHDSFATYLYSIEATYHRDNYYHNAIHATDVVQSTYHLLCHESIRNTFTPLELFATIIASAVHDADHPGLTNQFLSSTNDQLATLYNDQSILENHHLATAFNLMYKTGILASLSEDDKRNFRKLTIQIVKSTDMSHHTKLLAELKTLIEAESMAIEKQQWKHDTDMRHLVLSVIVHSADVSNPGKPLSLSREWTRRLVEEFYAQGDRERDLGLPISPMMDRTRPCVEKSQVGFNKYVVLPLFEQLADVVPEARHCVDQLYVVCDWWKERIPQGQ